MTSEIIWESYKNTYPSLANITFENGNLIFPDGKKIEGINLSLISPSIFEMNPTNLYIYLSNQFYKHNEEMYNNEIDKIFNLFTQLIITEDEDIILKQFAYDFWLRLQLYYNETCLAKDEDFIKELMARRKVITESFKSPFLAATVIVDTYNQNIIKTTDNSQTNSNDNSNSNIQNNGLSLSRQKSGVPKIINDEITPNANLGIAGFASLIIIIGSTIIFGIYLGLTLMK